MQYSFSIIKPDAMEKNVHGEIISDVLLAGYEIVALKMVKLSNEKAQQFYAEHKDKSFFPSLIAYMTSRPVIVFVVKKNTENTIEEYRKLLGSTDPNKAEENTLRKKYGTNITANALHGSDSETSYKREVAFFFAENEIYG